MLTSALPVTPSVPTPIPVSSALVEPVSRVTVVSVKISMNVKLVKKAGCEKKYDNKIDGVSHWKSHGSILYNRIKRRRTVV